MASRTPRWQKRQIRRDLINFRETLIQNIERVEGSPVLPKRSREKALSALRAALTAVKTMIRKGRFAKDRYDSVFDQGKHAIDLTARLLKYNTPPWSEAMLRFMLFEDLYKVRVQYSAAVQAGNTKQVAFLTTHKVTDAIKPFGRARNLLRRLHSEREPNGDTIRAGMIVALAWPSGGGFARENARLYYERLSKALDPVKRDTFQRAGGTSNTERTFDRVREQNEAPWVRVLTAEFDKEDRKVVDRYLKILWGRSAKLTGYGTQAAVDFKEKEVPKLSTIRQPPDTQR